MPELDARPGERRRGLWPEEIDLCAEEQKDFMTVADLISILKTIDQNAQVVLWDRDATGTPAVSKLGMGEVQPVELFCEEEFGSMWLELAADHPESDGVRLPGVVLGSP